MDCERVVWCGGGGRVCGHGAVGWGVCGVVCVEIAGLVLVLVERWMVGIEWKGGGMDGGWKGMEARTKP